MLKYCPTVVGFGGGTRTPLLTNSAQLLGRAAFISVFLEQFGVLAIPMAFAVTASLETVALTTILLLRLRRLGLLVETSS